jgi:peptidoglycan/xylan/chitin deacetylase (PgdA/CDA1 family)
MDVELTHVPLVLMYHSVEPYESDPYQVTVHPDRLDRQLGQLRRWGLRGVSMAELLLACRNGRGDGLVGLTFDDGYTDFVTEVMPALARHGCTATVFVVAGALGGHNAWDEPGPRKTLMTAADVEHAAAAGHEVGSHNLTHVRMPELAEDDLIEQVRRSREILAGIAGREIDGFCYPYGGAGDREVRAVRAAGYDYACAVRSSAVAGRHSIPRTFVGDRDTAPRLLAKVARHRLVHRRPIGRAA